MRTPNYAQVTGDYSKLSGFSYAPNATDVNFQQAYRRSGSLEDGNGSFSGKNQLYEYKAELRVLLNGFAIGSSLQYPVSVSYFEIFQLLKEWNKGELRKSPPECLEVDHGLQSDDFLTSCALLTDNGQQVILDICSVISSIQNTPKFQL